MEKSKNSKKTEKEKIESNNIDKNNSKHRASIFKAKITRIENKLIKRKEELEFELEFLNRNKNANEIVNQDGDVITIANSQESIEDSIEETKRQIEDIDNHLQRLFNTRMKLFNAENKMSISILDYCVSIYKNVTAFKTENNSWIDAYNAYFDSLSKNKRPKLETKLKIINYFRKNFQRIKEEYFKQKSNKDNDYTQKSNRNINSESNNRGPLSRKDLAAGEKDE